MAKGTHSFKYKWHIFWLEWHETKEHYYGSSRHLKKKMKHAYKAAVVINTFFKEGRKEPAFPSLEEEYPLQNENDKPTPLNPKVTES